MIPCACTMVCVCHNSLRLQRTCVRSCTAYMYKGDVGIQRSQMLPSPGAASYRDPQIVWVQQSLVQLIQTQLIPEDHASPLVSVISEPGACK